MFYFYSWNFQSNDIWPNKYNDSISVGRVLEQNRSLNASNRKIVIISVSPQTRASLAARYSLSTCDTSTAINNFFTALGASLVLDTSFARHIALDQAAKEFIERQKI